jgi:ABC-type antimicrobial peptide transport system ATPase subunit
MLSAYFTSIVNAIIALTSLGAIISKGLQSVRSLGEILESPDLEANEGKTFVTEVSGEIIFHNVSYKYLGSDKEAVSNLDLTVPAGETIALVGSSGSGKSTLINLMIGFVRPTSGYITCDNARLESLDMRTLRKFISVVPQETVLFNASIKENISYGLPDVTDQQIANAQLVDAKITIQGSYVKNATTQIFELQTFNFVRMFIASALSLFLLFTIFQFNNRKRQVGIARILVIAQFAFVIYLLSSLQQQITAAGITKVRMGLGVALPSIAILFTAMAAKAIRKDEEKVRAADRIR